jgi:hypothetical protein
MSTVYLPTLYKARKVPAKSPVCAVCADRTRGRTAVVKLTHGVSVSLCEGHASVEFQTQRSGRDFVVTLMRIWEANGCLTIARRRALEAHLEQQRSRPPRSRPGSYAWPELRRRLERAYAGGEAVGALSARVQHTHRTCPARPPSIRTLYRWRERRWVNRA